MRATMALYDSIVFGGHAGVRCRRHVRATSGHATRLGYYAWIEPALEAGFHGG